jgi:hypothetical protein
LISRISAHLELPETAGIRAIADYLHSQKNRFVIMIDEADKFIRNERTTGYAILNGLRRLSEEGTATFIIAGFWELYEHAVLDYQSPLKNFAEIIEIGALEEDACRNLATQPMRHMRLEYANPTIVDTLLKTTGLRANLVVITCAQILAGIKPDQRIITEDDVTRALRAEKTLNALRGWDALTDDEESCRLDRITVYATIEKETFTLANLAGRLKQNNIKVDGRKLDLSLSRLTLAFVLGKDEKGVYYYRVPLFREMILCDDPKTKLDLAMENR